MTEEKYIEVTKIDAIEEMWSLLKLGRRLHKFINKDKPWLVTPEMLEMIYEEARNDNSIIGYMNDGEVVTYHDIEDNGYRE
jgi:hypothetical protein